MRLITLFACLTFVLTSRAVPTTLSPRAPPLPASDPFYTPPKGFESSAPGTILRHRKSTVALFSGLPENVAASYQLLYRTNDINGKPTATVQSVFVPYHAAQGPTKLLSYQVAEDSASGQCAPSYQYLKDAGSSNVIAQAEVLFINAALRKGWTVVSPDYEGPKSAFTAGHLAGMGTLDGIRAATHFKHAVPNPKNVTIGMMGYSGEYCVVPADLPSRSSVTSTPPSIPPNFHAGFSLAGGALASGWAAQMQPKYAPELSIVGAALGGLPVSVKNILFHINKGPAAGIAVGGISGLANVYDDLGAYLASHVFPNGTEVLAKGRSQCLQDDVLDFGGLDVFSLINATNPLDAPAPKKALAQNDLNLATGSPRIPLYVYQSVGDEIVVTPDVDQYVKQQCKKGATIDYLRDAVSDHISLAITGAAGAFE